MSIRSGIQQFSPPAGYTGGLQYVWIGDSIINSHGTTGENNKVSDFFSREQWRTDYFLTHNIVASKSVNKGVNGDTTTKIKNRFVVDAINLNPSVGFIINGGINDINASTAKNAFLSNWITILDLCAATGKKAFVLSVGPWTNANAAKIAVRDDFNAGLASVVALYKNAKIINYQSAVGKARVGGGAYDDISPLYDYDGVHYTYAGYLKIAEHIYTSINSIHKR